MPSQKKLRNGYVMVYKYKSRTSQIPEPRPKPPQAVLDALKQILGIVTYLGRLVASSGT